MTAKDIEELIEWVGIKQNSREEASEQRADDSDDGRDDPAARIVSRHERLRVIPCCDPR